MLLLFCLAMGHVSALRSGSSPAGGQCCCGAAAGDTLRCLCLSIQTANPMTVHIYVIQINNEDITSEGRSRNHNL